MNEVFENTSLAEFKYLQNTAYLAFKRMTLELIIHFELASWLFTSYSSNPSIVIKY